MASVSDDGKDPRAREVRYGEIFRIQREQQGEFGGSDTTWEFVDILLRSLVDPEDEILTGTNRSVGRFVVGTSIGELTVYYTLNHEDNTVETNFFRISD